MSWWSSLLLVMVVGCATSKPAQLSNAEILDVLRSHAPEIEQCKREQHTGESSFSGKITVRLVITNEGLPTKIGVTPQSSAETMGVKCVLAKVEAWRFPPFTGLATPIDFPVEF